MSFATYLSQISKYKQLSYEEFRDLLAKAQKGNRRARNKIVEYNLRLVVYIAKRYGNSKISIEDLIAEGNFGLFEVIKQFKPSQGYQFSTYAFYWIKQKIARYIDDTINLIRVPVWVSDTYRKILKKPQKQKKKTEKTLQLGNIKIASLHSLIKDNSELLDFLGITYPITEKIDSRLILETLEYLSIRNKSILKDRLRGITLKKIGKKHKLSSERIRHIEIESIDKIREILLKKDLKV